MDLIIYKNICINMVNLFGSKRKKQIKDIISCDTTLRNATIKNVKIIQYNPHNTREYYDCLDKLINFLTNTKTQETNSSGNKIVGTHRIYPLNGHNFFNLFRMYCFKF